MLLILSLVLCALLLVGVAVYVYWQQQRNRKRDRPKDGEAQIIYEVVDARPCFSVREIQLQLQPDEVAANLHRMELSQEEKFNGTEFSCSTDMRTNSSGGSVHLPANRTVTGSAHSDSVNSSDEPARMVDHVCKIDEETLRLPQFSSSPLGAASGSAWIYNSHRESTHDLTGPGMSRKAHGRFHPHRSDLSEVSEDEDEDGGFSDDNLSAMEDGSGWNHRYYEEVAGYPCSHAAGITWGTEGQFRVAYEESTTFGNALQELQCKDGI
uniref:Uncharacterized protein n=1 Tax=Chromera velia CCMP2878 TaxID=1169474 RepID=A0A0G4F348_9ALVE|eukprot:Cvel_14865.t1-p1 / transcript=Cvel_14865.t1 / gene=Cvel_14865 / organism=Chromera_velia_CCMP2878 / gene_product=hypothetical protein / transcript_product=hypothetical protein / location=Cvel_scaffold1075:6750-7547(+) / protein_length=266 / sequence_SO=supercontig / SO=protein_coding / is_pseudo=false